MRLILTLILLLPVIASADSQLWMKKDEPNELAFFAFASSYCPMSNGELGNEARDAFVRARIRPIGLMESDFGYPYVYINLQCSEQSTEETAIAYLQIDFIDEIELGDTRKQDIRFEIESQYAFIWSGPSELLGPYIRDHIEDMLADYIRANFDFGEQGS